MSDEQFKTSKTTYSSRLGFFSGTVSSLNDTRQVLSRGKSLARYLTATKKNLRDLSRLDTTLGVMSFSLYLLRLVTNLGLLAELVLVDPKDKNQKVFRELSYSLFNDSLWGIVNFIQFFCLSSKKSPSAGLYGMQLETLAQLIDLVVMIIRYEQDRQEYWIQHEHATEHERGRLAIDWRNKELNIIRALLTGVSVVIAFGLVAFSIIAVPLAPIMAVIILINSLGKIVIDISRDKQIIQYLKSNDTNLEQITHKTMELMGARFQDMNQLILKNIFLPLGFIVLLTTPMSVTVVAVMGMAMLHYLLTQLIKEQQLLARVSNDPMAEGELSPATSCGT